MSLFSVLGLLCPTEAPPCVVRVPTVSGLNKPRSEGFLLDTLRLVRAIPSRFALDLPGFCYRQIVVARIDRDRTFVVERTSSRFTVVGKLLFVQLGLDRQRHSGICNQSGVLFLGSKIRSCRNYNK
jgi:hypothetical protein